MQIKALSIHSTFFGLLLPLCIGATPEEAYKHGLSMGSAFKQQDIKEMKEIAAFSGNKEEREQANHYQQNLDLPQKNLSDAAVLEINANKAGQLVVESEKSRAKFETAQKTHLESYAGTIIPQAPTLIKNQNQDCIEIPFLEQKAVIEQHSCEVSREPEEKTCIRYLKEPTVEVIPAKYSHYWCAAGNHRPDDSNCRAKAYFNPAKMYQAEQVTISPEEWVSQCAPLEARAECKEVKVTCLEPNQTRIISERPVTKPCWKEEHTYACQYPSKNDCGAYHQSECQQIGSTCQLKVDDKCYIWQHKYECKKEQRLTTKRICGKDVFCIQGECYNPQSTESRDFLEVMSQLSIFNEIQKTASATFPEIFRGSTENCKKDLVSFKSCCKVGGWGTSLGLADCKPEEKLLAEKRDKKLCHEIGKYCSKKRLGVCIEKKTVFCCFGSKLMRILHEQGRSQAGLNWGEPESPQCRGFTVEELSRIDFSSLNLNEIFQDLKPSFSPETVDRMQNKIQNRLTKFQNAKTEETQEGKTEP